MIQFVLMSKLLILRLIYKNTVYACELTFSIPNGTKDNKTEISKLRKLLA